MCKICDLKVMVVEPNREELDRICNALQSRVVTSIICVTKCKDAITILENEKDVDIIVSDLDLEDMKPSGLYLCKLAKSQSPGTLFLISSRNSGIYFLGQSWSAGADATLNCEHPSEVDVILERWLNLAVKRRDVDETINSK